MADLRELQESPWPIDVSDEARRRPTPLPEVLWIELTSRCPFDCVFCSRKLVRGAGQHMDLALYRRLIGELKAPRIIRLNYSGESIHYPHLVEACELAAATGADVELVTALAALPWAKLEPLARAGIRRLTVSLHTLDPERFRDIYRFSELSALTARLEALRQIGASQAQPTEIDLAFVAMQRNLDELPAVAAFAQQLGLPRLAVHPVIRRDPIEERFEAELDDGRLRPTFLAALAQRVQEARAVAPGVAIELSTPEMELETCPTLDERPRYHPGEIPGGARLFDCDQDPWHTVHVLADGSVVTCELRDKVVLGNLQQHSMAEIWHGEAYHDFRMRFLLAMDATCRRCPYKRAQLPSLAPSRILPGREGESGLISGWYPDPHETWVWSAPEAQLRLRWLARQYFQVRVLLPDSEEGSNRVRLWLGDRLLDEAHNHGRAPIECRLRGRSEQAGDTWLRLEVERVYRPDRRGHGPNQRALGVALLAVERL